MKSEARGAAKASAGASGAPERIIAAAQRLFPRRGYRGTSMDDIAEEAGLAKATLYLHFDGKDAIFRALFDRCREEITVRAKAAEQADGPLADRLTALIYAYIGTALEFFGDVNHLRDAHVIVAADPARFGATGDQDLDGRIAAMLKRAARQAEIVVAGRSTSSSTIAGVLSDLARGAKVEGITPAQYKIRISRACSIIVAGIAK